MKAAWLWPGAFKEAVPTSVGGSARLGQRPYPRSAFRRQPLTPPPIHLPPEFSGGHNPPGLGDHALGRGRGEGAGRGL